jgi:hypothetical protein
MSSIAFSGEFIDIFTMLTMIRDCRRTKVSVPQLLEREHVFLGEYSFFGLLVSGIFT